MFMHGSILHIAGNMLFLWIFGNNVEDALGHIKFIGFYLLGGVAALALQVLVAPNSTAPTVGASGAIAAVLGGYIVLYPRARVLTFVFIILFFTVIELPAIVMLGIWFAEQAVFGAAGLTNPAGGGGGVAYFAHVGGFVFGALTIRLLASKRRRGLALRFRRTDRVRYFLLAIVLAFILGLGRADRARHLALRADRGQRAGRGDPRAVYDRHRRGSDRAPTRMSDLGVLQEGRARRAAREASAGVGAAAAGASGEGLVIVVLGVVALLVFMASGTSGPASRPGAASPPAHTRPPTSPVDGRTRLWRDPGCGGRSRQGALQAGRAQRAAVRRTFGSCAVGARAGAASFRSPA